MIDPSPAAGLPLPLVFRLRLGHRLPLHIARCIRTAAREWIDVVDHVAFAGPLPRTCRGAGVLGFELDLGGLAALGACLGRGGCACCGKCERERDQGAPRRHFSSPYTTPPTNIAAITHSSQLPELSLSGSAGWCVELVSEIRSL